MLRTLILSAGLALVATTAQAQSAYVEVEKRFNAEEMHEAGLDTLSAAQLAALNRLLREKQLMPTPTNSTAEGHSRTDAPRSYIGLDDKPIHSRVKGNVDGWAPGTVFELENGQQWKVLKGEMKLRKPLHAPEIVVVPGIAGRWFLQVDEDMPKARVYRID